MNIIEAKDIEKTYDSDGLSVTALGGVDVAIEKGEFTALAGPSGSGKTTLLNIIGGLDFPTGGSIKVDNVDLGGLKAKALADIRLTKIGFVFQAYNLIPVLTAVENVEYVLLLRGMSKKERRKRSADVLEQVGLSDQIDRRPHELSGGQQQRVAVARAIVSEPAIVLADEPTANLDQKTGAKLCDMMRELNEDKKITFLFSTHDHMVMERARRLVHLIDGKVVGEDNK